MTKEIVTNEVIIENSDQNIFNFITDFKNFTNLLPDNVRQWNSDTNSCSFLLMNVAQINISIADQTPFSKVVLAGNSNVGVKLNVDLNIYKISESQTKVGFAGIAEFPNIFKNVILGPISKTLDDILEKLKEVMENKI